VTKAYLGLLRWPFVFSSSLFSISVFAGYFAGEMFQGLLDKLEEFYGEFKGLSPIRLMVLIFLNNSLKSLLMILLGFLFMVFPILFIVGNGLFWVR
jgi:stage II sporulation protein M